MAASPFVICLDDAARAELEAVSRRATAPFRLVQRARIVLLAASGLENRAVASRLGTCEDTAAHRAPPAAGRRQILEASRGSVALGTSVRYGRSRLLVAVVRGS